MDSSQHKAILQAALLAPYSDLFKYRPQKDAPCTQEGLAIDGVDSLTAPYIHENLQVLLESLQSLDRSDRSMVVILTSGYATRSRVSHSQVDQCLLQDRVKTTKADTCRRSLFVSTTTRAHATILSQYSKIDAFPYSTHHRHRPCPPSLAVFCGEPVGEVEPLEAQVGLTKPTSVVPTVLTRTPARSSAALFPTPLPGHSCTNVGSVSHQATISSCHKLPILQSAPISLHNHVTHAGSSSGGTGSTKLSTSTNSQRHKSRVEKSTLRNGRGSGGRKNGPGVRRGRPDDCTDDTPQDKKQRFPCPYFMRSPQKFRHCSAVMYLPENSHHLKEHMEIHHFRGGYLCCSCDHHFTEEADLHAHRQNNLCIVGRNQDYLKGFDKIQYNELHDTRSPRSGFRGVREHLEKWRVMYRIVFPDAWEIPDPFINPDVRDCHLFSQERARDGLPRYTIAEFDDWRNNRPSTHWHWREEQIPLALAIFDAQFTGFPTNLSGGLALPLAEAQDTANESHDLNATSANDIPLRSVNCGLQIPTFHPNDMPELDMGYEQSHPSEFSSGEPSLHLPASTDQSWTTTTTFDSLLGAPTPEATITGILEPLCYDHASFGENPISLHPELDVAPSSIQESQLVQIGSNFKHPISRNLDTE